LLERRPDQSQVRTAIAVGFLWFASGLCIYVLGDIPLREFPLFVAVVDAILFTSDFVIAALLFSQASVFRSRALMALASGYLYAALMAVPHALTFPGTFAPMGLLGAGLSSTAWLSVFWRAGLPLAIGVYAVLKRRDAIYLRRTSIGIAASVCAAFVATIAASTLAIHGVDLLPPLVAGPRNWHYPEAVHVVTISIGLCLAAIAVLMMGEKSRLDVWLLLSLSPWLVHLLLIVSTPGRFTLAWYFAFAAALVSHVIVMLALITEAGRTYARLALLASARDRERDARLMSMDAVAATIAHEVRQPLAAMVTNSSAALRWLDREPPDLQMVSKSLRSNIEQGHRASGLIESMRSVLAQRTGERTTFSLNELVRETTSMLDHDLARGKITMHLTLDEALPEIVADRVQMQQVLVNLFTNAIEALRPTRGRSRRIVIRSAPLDGHDVLLDVSDNGVGIADDNIEHIFDAFFTTKRTGAGMGLSLCRSIVEKHGGRLWASHGGQHGAIFHLQLPHGGMPTGNTVKLEEAKHIERPHTAIRRAAFRSQSD
jgi:signal transduction histidine kinase